MKKISMFFQCLGIVLFLASCGNSNTRNAEYVYEPVDTACDGEILYSGNNDEDDITPDDVIREVVKKLKSSMPYELAFGLTMTDAYLQGSYLFIEVSCDDDEVSVYDIADNKAGAHENVLAFAEKLASTNSDWALIFAALVEKHMGMCYRYVSDETGDYVDIKLKYSELANMF